MAHNAFLLMVVAIVRTLASVTLAEPVPVAPILDVSSFNRSSFPSGFVFGTASAAYQVHVTSHVKKSYMMQCLSVIG